VALKDKYDPDSVFALNENIPPTTDPLRALARRAFRRASMGRCVSMRGRLVSLPESEGGAGMTAILDRLRGLKERTAQRRADRARTRMERAERRAVSGDRQQQLQNRDYSRGPGAPGPP
jgi:hypothetical protein